MNTDSDSWYDFYGFYFTISCFVFGNHISTSLCKHSKYSMDVIDIVEGVICYHLVNNKCITVLDVNLQCICFVFFLYFFFLFYLFDQYFAIEIHTNKQYYYNYILFTFSCCLNPCFFNILVDTTMFLVTSELNDLWYKCNNLII